jgi:UDP-N-acetyl-D-glucosamine dehydrogenase
MTRKPSSARGRTPAENLIHRLEKRTARLGVIGLGYVGLPLAVELAQAGFEVFGVDIDEARVRQLNQGKSYIQDVPTADLQALVRQGRFKASTDFGELRRCDTVNICVPTPLSKQRDPDVSYIVSAAGEVKKYLHKGMLVILESTTYPGTTDELVLPMLAETGLKVGKDFFLAFSPERVDPANEQFTTRNTPKVVGGTTPACVDVATALYRSAIDTVVPVTSTQVAEMVKLLENTFRAVNIGLVNELALMCHRMGINVWEVIEAAKTKPFGFMPFYPGPGLGGHCIPIDPFYLSWKARQYHFECRFIELAGHINGSMPEYVLQRVSEALNTRKRAINGSRIHIFGVAYKKDVSDMRESPALDIIELLHRRGAIISYSDPYVPELCEGELDLKAVPGSAAGNGIDCAVICTDHRAFNYEAIAKAFPLVVDTRNAMKGITADNVFRL